MDIAIEEEIMRVFAQNEQRQRKAKQYYNLYERRDKERVLIENEDDSIARRKATEDCGRSEDSSRMDEWNR